MSRSPRTGGGVAPRARAALAALVGVAGLASGCRNYPTVNIPKATTPPTPPGPLFATASPAAVAPLGSALIQPTGGVHPYAFAFLPPGPASGAGASIDSMGNYRAGPIGPVEDRIAVTDSDGGAIAVVIDVGLPLVLSPLAAQVNPGASVSFTAQDGQPPYRFVLASTCASADGGPAGSSLQGGAFTAVLVAGVSCGNTTAAISVFDANDAGAGPASVTVGAGVSVIPSQAATPPGQTLSFVAAGGVAPYTFAFARHGNRSGGSLSADGAYRAGLNPTEVDFIQVTDQNGLSGSAQVMVGNASVTLAEPGLFLLYPGSLYGIVESISSDLVAVPNYETESVSAQVIEVFQGTPTGLVPAVTVDAPENLLGLITPDAYEAAVGNLCLDTSNLFGDQQVLQSFSILTTGALGAGGQLPVESSTGAAAVEEAGSPGTWIYANSFTQFGDAGSGSVQYGDGGVAAAAIAFYTLSESATGSTAFNWVGAAPVALPSGAYLEWVIGRGGTLVAIGSSPTTDDYLFRWDGFTLLGDGGLEAQASAPVDLGTNALPYVSLGLADFDGDGRPDAYLYTADLLGGDGLQAYLSAGDGGLFTLSPLELPTSFDLRATPQTNADGGTHDVLEVIGPEGSFRTALVIDGGALELTLVDAGYPSSTCSLAWGDFNLDGVLDLALASPSGEVTIERGELLGRFGGGNAFAFAASYLSPWVQVAPPLPGPVPEIGVGDIDGDGIAEVAVGTQGLDLLSGAGVDLLSSEGLWASQVTVVAASATSRGAYGIAVPPEGSPYLVWVGPGDGGWTEVDLPLDSLSISQSSPLPYSLQAMSAGSALPESDLLVTGQNADGSPLFVAARRSGSTLVPAATATLGMSYAYQAGNAVAWADADAGLDDLVLAVGATDGAGQLVRFTATGSPPAWPTGPSVLFSSDSLAPDDPCGQLLFAEAGGVTSTGTPPALTPFAWQASAPPQAALMVGSFPCPSDAVDGGGSFVCWRACVFDAATSSASQVLSENDAVASSTVFAGDVDGDGRTDLVYQLGPSLEVAFGYGAGAVAAPQAVTTDPALANFTLVGLGDFDGDHRADALLLNQGIGAAPYLSVLHGTPDGGFD